MNSDSVDSTEAADASGLTCIISADVCQRSEMHVCPAERHNIEDLVICLMMSSAGGCTVYNNSNMPSNDRKDNVKIR